MNILKNILGTIFMFFGLLTIILYLLGIFSINIGGNQIPTGRNFATEFWGYISALLSFGGGYLLIKNNLVSKWLVIGSVIFYVLGAIIPHWSSHGIGVLNNLMNQFYFSVTVRVFLTVLAIYAIHKVISANKLVQSTPKGGVEH